MKAIKKWSKFRATLERVYKQAIWALSRHCCYESCTGHKYTMPKYVFTYFDGRGRGEPGRMLFAVAGVPFEDKRISQEEWPALKSSKHAFFSLVYRVIMVF